MSKERGKMRKNTDKETSCFQTGLWAFSLPKRPKRPLDLVGEDEAVDGVLEPLLPVGLPLLFGEEPFASACLMSFRAETALLEEDLLEERARFVGVPFISLSDSGMGSLEMNSLCSNWTTT